MCAVPVTTLEKDVEALEGVHKRFTEMFSGLVYISYKESLDKLGIVFSGALDAEGKDYKIMRGTYDKADSQHIF